MFLFIYKCVIVSSISCKRRIFMEWFKCNINNLSFVDYEKWFSLMADKKKGQINRMRHEDDKKRSVVGEMLVKNAVYDISGVPIEKLTLKTTENGKPYIEISDIHFNISHCEDWVVCAIHNKPIGIDIEKIRPINLKIAKRFFTADEQNYVFSGIPKEEDFDKTADSDMLKRFFEVWTGKEAYLKYKGTGITDNLNALYVNENNLITEYFDDYVVRIYTE